MKSISPVTRKRCFDPVVDANTRLLLLGSLPGERSLASRQYYGNPQNKFWELVGEVTGVDLRALPYEERLAALLARGIGLWDTIAEAERPGSLDAEIRNASHNPLVELVESLPELRAVAFNGGTAARIGRKQLSPYQIRLALLDLPSSSPAHTIGYAQKLRVWNQLHTFL